MHFIVEEKKKPKNLIGHGLTARAAQASKQVEDAAWEEASWVTSDLLMVIACKSEHCLTLLEVGENFL